MTYVPLWKCVLFTSFLSPSMKLASQDYVVQQWDEVSNSSEFERCLEEISAGEWGPEGGKVLTRLFRRLRSPIA